MLDKNAVDGPRAWFVAFISFLLCAIALGSTILIVISLKEIAVAEGWPRESPSFVYAMAITGAGVGGIFMGWWSDRRGVRGPITLGTFGVGFGAILASQAEAAWQLALVCGVLMGGFGSAAFFAPLIANATRWFDRRRGIAVALVACGQNLAGAVWPRIFRYATELDGWRTAFFAYGVFVLVTVLPLSLFVGARPPAHAAPKRRDVSDGEREKVARVIGMSPRLAHAILFAMQMLCCLAMSAPFVHGPAHVSDLGHSMNMGANMLSIVLATSILSLMTLGHLADRMGGLRTLMIASAVQAVALAMYAGFESLPMLFASAVVFGLGFGGLVPSYAIVIREIFPVREVGWRIASIFFGGTLGMAGGGWLAGWIFDGSGHYHDAFLLGFAFNIANLLLAATLLPGWLGHRRLARSGI